MISRSLKSFVLLLAFAPLWVNAAIVTSVEYVEVSINSTSAVTVNLTKGQDETQMVPFWSVRHLGVIGDVHQDRLANIEFIDNAGTAAVRVTASGRTSTETTVFQIFAVEFAAAINVQQVAVTTLTATVQDVTVTIADVGAQSEAFMIYAPQFANPGASAGDNDDWNDAMAAVSFDGASTTSAAIARQGSASDLVGTLYVVDCDAGEFTVEHVLLSTAAGGDTLLTATIASTVLADTFLVTSWEGSEGQDDMRDMQWEVDLQDPTTVRARRAVAAAPTSSGFNINLAVIEAQNSEWDVQRANALAVATATVTDTITAIDQNRSIIKLSGHHSGMNSSPRNDSTSGGGDNHLMPTGADFSADTTGRFRRQADAETNALLGYEVIQFELVTAGGVSAAPHYYRKRRFN